MMDKYEEMKRGDSPTSSGPSSNPIDTVPAGASQISAGCLHKAVLEQISGLPPFCPFG